MLSLIFRSISHLRALGGEGARKTVFNFVALISRMVNPTDTVRPATCSKKCYVIISTCIVHLCDVHEGN